MIQEIIDPFFQQIGIGLFVKRLDLQPKLPSGNKYFKLKYNIEEALAKKHDSILSFGGAYSNHLLACSVAAKIHSLKSIGIVRGEKHAILNPILKAAEENGMELHYVDREKYRLKETPEFHLEIEDKFGRVFLIPEGGSNKNAVKGCSEILTEEDSRFDHIFCACGTGGTLAGIILSLKEHQTANGISVLKGGEFLNKNVQDFLKEFPDSKKEWKIHTEFAFAGYAKSSAELNEFILQFKEQTGIPIEPVYTGKMFYAVYTLIKSGYFKKGTKILCIHTGGLDENQSNDLE